MTRTKADVAAEHLAKKQKREEKALQEEEEEYAAQGDRCAVGTKCLMQLSKCNALARIADEHSLESWSYLKAELQEMMQGTELKNPEDFEVGWCDPFDWKLRALQKLNSLCTVIDKDALRTFLDAIYSVNYYHDLPRALTLEMPQKMVDCGMRSAASFYPPAPEPRCETDPAAMGVNIRGRRIGKYLANREAKWIVRRGPVMVL